MSLEDSKTQDVAITTSPEKLQQWLEEAIQLMGGQRGLIVTPIPDSEDMRVEAAVGVDPETVWEMGDISHTILLKVAATKRGVLTHNASEDYRFQNANSVVLAGLRSVLTVPIKTGEDLWGVLYVDNLVRIGAFEDPHLRQLREFAAKMGAALAAGELA